MGACPGVEGAGSGRVVMPGHCSGRSGRAHCGGLRRYAGLIGIEIVRTGAPVVRDAKGRKSLTGVARVELFRFLRNRSH